MAEGQKAPVNGAKPKGTIAFDDAALVEQCRRGDMQAFGSLVAKYQDRIFNMVYRMCGRRADAEELTQEAFLKALERIGQFRGQSQFYTWLFRIAANLTISHRRRSGRVRFQSLTGPEEFEQSQADALTASMARRRNPAPEAAAMAAETQRRIMQALEELDDEFRLVVVLCDVEGMDYARIADVLGVPVGTVKSRLHRARCMLKEKLADLRVER
jgi:RNA polymerase sigma-70 factor (ECF subfamily)